MHSVLWYSIVASALVAVITTLLVEYLAKPGLEARRERIVEEKRGRRNAMRGILQALSLLERLQNHKEGTPRSVSRDYLVAITGKFTERIETASDALKIPESLDGEWARIAAAIETFEFAVQAGQPPAEAWKMLKSVTHELELFYHYLRVSRWRCLYRRRVLRELISYPHYEETEEALEDFEDDDSLPG